jgi:hypothetical protein
MRLAYPVKPVEKAVGLPLYVTPIPLFCHENMTPSHRTPSVYIIEHLNHKEKSYLRRSPVSV